MNVITAAFATLLFRAAAAFSPTKTNGRSHANVCLNTGGSISFARCPPFNHLLQARYLDNDPDDIDELSIGAFSINNGDNRLGQNEDNQNQISSPTASSLLSLQLELLQERIQSGNILDVLQISVIAFFLATIWLSGGRLLHNDSNYTNNNASITGKARIYKYVDAEKLLQEDFERESSTVIF